MYCPQSQYLNNINSVLFYFATPYFLLYHFYLLILYFIIIIFITSFHHVFPLKKYMLYISQL